jgi:uncharacterized protein (DUF433 family)
MRAFRMTIPNHPRITIDPERMFGKPSIRGLRFTVSDVLDYLASGMTEEELLDDFPYLEREDIKAALRFAAEREHRIAVL